ncbi:LysR family transcriptional regulator ArgP [Herbaspirillum sp. HC18]|nr:LysR family transcriptional regulator ArgP [Herbaspirillum sp. HC18]
MQIDNAQLAAFTTVLREGTFELAARKLSVTPSAISQRIKLLEDRIGQVLIQRTSPCQPTAAGQVLLRYASEVALLESEVFAVLGGDAGQGPRMAHIPIVVNADSLDSWFEDVLEAVSKDGSLSLDVRVEDQDHSAELLREGIVMAGVSASDSAVQGCRVEVLGTMRYLAVASPDYIARHFSAGVSDERLNEAPILAFSRKDALQAAFLSVLAGQPVNPPIHFMPTTRSFLEAACCGLGWGMMPEQIALDAIKAGRLREFASTHWLDVPLYWHRSRIKARSLDLLSSMVHRAAKQRLVSNGHEG